MSLTEPVLIRPSAGRTVTKSSGSSTELKLSGEQADGGWAVVEWHLRAGDEPPIHTHTREDETLYVLDGSITAFVGDQRIDVEGGRRRPKAVRDRAARTRPGDVSVEGGAARAAPSPISDAGAAAAPP
jgi:hypothetical protein